MRSFTIGTIRSWGPCYDPSRYLSEDWGGTVVDILRNESIPVQDRLWVVLRTELVSERLMRLFAVWSARQVQHLMKDERSVKALDVAQRFAMGEATNEELNGARNAYAAAADAATNAVAAYAAANAYAAAATEAAYAAANAANAAYAAQKTQTEKLIEMVERESQGGCT